MRKARNILTDWARKTSLEIVMTAKRLGYAVAREDLTWLIKSLRKLPKSHRVKLIIMGFARIGKWIDWQAMKHGVPLAIVDPRDHRASAQNAIQSSRRTAIEG